MGLGVPELIILLMIASSTLILMWPAGRICKRAGFSPWLGVLIVIPLANIFLLWFLAVSPWPALPEANRGDS